MSKPLGTPSTSLVQTVAVVIGGVVVVLLMIALLAFLTFNNPGVL